MDYLNELIRDIQYFKSAIQSGEFERSVANNILDIVEGDVDEIYRSAIDEWYSSYYPGFYNRQHSLYSMYKIRRKGTAISWDESARYSSGSHRASEDVIFQNSFVRGYHGGAAFDEDEVLIPEVPNGFKPKPYDGPYNRPWAKIRHAKWDKYAEQSDSPLDIANKQIERYNSKWNAQLREIFEDEVSAYIPAYGGN